MNRINPINNTNDQTPIYKPELLEALRGYRHEKPWRGTLAERIAKLGRLHDKLCPQFDCGYALDSSRIPEPEERHGNGGLRHDHGASSIVLVGKLSVVTYLYCFGMVIFNRDRLKANAWAVGLYRRIFRRSAARMNFQTVDGETYVLAPNVEQN